jgi:hypothetical protein
MNSGARARAKQLVACPVAWSSADMPIELRWRLHGFWVEYLLDSDLWTPSLQNIDDDGRVDYVEDPLDTVARAIDTEDSDDLLAVASDELQQWIEKAREDYRQRTRRFTIKVLTQAADQKHFTAQGKSREAIRAMSLDGDGRFYPEITPAILQLALWDLLLLRFDEYVGDVDQFVLDETLKTEASQPRRPTIPTMATCVAPDHVRHDLDARMVIGASKGQDTSIVRFDLDFSTPHAHGYPVRRSDVDETQLRKTDTFLASL